MKFAASFSHLLQHLYIGAGPLLFPLIMKELGISYSYIGLIISLRTFFAGFCQIFYSFSRRILSRKVILLLSNAITGLSSIGMGISTSFNQFLFYNGLWGASTSPIHPLTGSLIADSSRKTKTGVDIGLFYSYAYIGNLIGVIIVVLFLPYIDYRGIFLVMGLSTATMVIYGFFISDETVSETRKKKYLIREFKRALKDKRVILTSIVGLFFFGGTNVFVRHLAPLYIINQIHLSTGYASIVFTIMSVIGIFSPPFFGWLSNKFDRRIILMFLALLLATLFFIIANQTLIAYNVITILFLESFLAWPILALLHAFLIDTLEPGLRNIGADILLTINVCSFILWASVFGYLIDISGTFKWTFYLISALCIVSLPLIRMLCV